MRNILLYIYTAVAVALLVSCHKTIHEHPYEELESTRIVRVVAVDATEGWRQYKQVLYSADGDIQVTNLGDALCEDIEEAVPPGTEISAALEIKLLDGDTQTLSRQRVGINEPQIYDLTEGPYRMTVWADYHPAYDTETDYLWDTSDLTNVSLFTQRLPIETAICEGFAASVDTVVTPSVDAADTMTVILPLRRAMGRIRFVPDDTEQMRRMTGCEDRLMARVSYTQFVPTGFDAESHTTCFVVTGYERYTVTDDDGTLTELVLCPSGRELSLRVSVTYFLPSGEEVGTVTGIPVPLWQGRETVVIGSLLTSGMHGVDGGGGMGIDESFEGENLVRYTKQKTNINPNKILQP